jgi:3-isopropylmalate/(R)-2-methylmalate dehydratase small subunit
MPSRPFESFTSTYVVLPVDNIDTDQIIPARFLKTTERTGLGGALFYDWRHHPDGTPNGTFPLNKPEAPEARVLVAGRNFGCGSSREHAVWALLGFGFRAVVSSEFADIFRGNALANGLLPIQVPAADVERLVAAARDGSPFSVTVELDSQTLTMPDGGTVRFPIAPFAQHCLLHGIDEMDFLLGAEGELATYEGAHAPRVSTVAANNAATVSA